MADNPASPNSYQYYYFEGATYEMEHLSLPYFTAQVDLPGRGVIGYEFLNTVYEPFDKVASQDDAVLGENLAVKTFVEQNRRRFSGRVAFIPIRKTGNRFEKLVSFEMKIIFRPTPPKGGFRNDFTYTSELSDGAIYKIAVQAKGLHKITYNFLKDDLKIDIDNIDPRTIKLLGNYGGSLPLLVGAARYDDLEENAIQVVGEEDGRFDSGDYILFYAEGPHRWEYNEGKERFDRLTNVFDNNKYYFLKISPGNGQRISGQGQVSGTDYTSTSFDDYLRFEEDKINLLFDMAGAQGSGRSWYGDLFNQVREKTYNFSFPFLDTSEPVKVDAEMIGRHNITTPV